MSKTVQTESMTREELITYIARLKSMIANLQQSNAKVLMAATASTHEYNGCHASALGWSIKYANLHELAVRLVQAKGRFHTLKAFEDLREFISSENAIVVAPATLEPESKNDVVAG